MLLIRAGGKRESRKGVRAEGGSVQPQLILFIRPLVSVSLILPILPILQRRGVTAYVFGHDHDLQHIAADGLHYIGCGAGSEVRPVAAVTGTQFCEARSGFAVIDMGRDGLSVEFRDYTGVRLHPRGDRGLNDKHWCWVDDFGATTHVPDATTSPGFNDVDDP